MKLFYITNSMFERNAAKVLSEAHTLLLCRRMYSRRTHYDVLNLKKDCTSDDVRQSFAKLSKMYHPDTSKTGNTESNSRKFQEIMEAYRVLRNKSSRDAYDSDISLDNSNNPYSPYSNPHYATPFRRRERRFYEGDFASWQQHMHENRQYTSGYYRTNGRRDNIDYDFWSPANIFSKKTVSAFLGIFVFLNFFVVYFTYMLSKQNRLLADFDGRNGRRLLYEMPRHGMYGIHAQQFEKSDPKNE